MSFAFDQLNLHSSFRREDDSGKKNKKHKNTMKTTSLFVSCALFMQCCMGKAITDNSVESQPECMVRSGRQIIIKLPFTGKNLNKYNLQSLDIATGELRNHDDCFTLDDSLWCASWLRRDYKNMRKNYRLQAIDSTTGEIAWKSELVFNPQKRLFYCFNHKIREMNILEIIPDLVILRWNRNSADDQFSPIHTITVGGVKNGQVVKQNEDCNEEKCQVELDQPTNTPCVQGMKSVCIKTKFNLNDGKNVYKKRHMIETCTTYLEKCSYTQTPKRSKI